MSPQRNWVAVCVCFFLAVSVAMAREREEDRRSETYLQVDRVHLHNGLPGGAWDVGIVRVGGPLAKDRTTEKDKSGQVIYTRTMTGQTRWLPDNAIEVMLEINENGVERTESVRLENFEPKAIVLRKDPSRNSIELLRFIPIFNTNGLPRLPAR